MSRGQITSELTGASGQPGRVASSAIKTGGRSKRIIYRYATRLLCSAFCFLFSAFGHAEELLDPTRPPAIISIPEAVAGSTPARLHSIIISKTRRAAIIDGETVELRDKHGDATLIEVSETGVVLQGAQGRQVLTLFPDVKIMQKDIQVTPKLSEKEGGLAQKTKQNARKERK